MLEVDVSGFVNAISTILPDVDKTAMIGNANLGQYLIDLVKEGLKNSTDGWVDDDLAFVRPWGFELDEIKVPVILYQGSEDKMVPFAHGQWLAKHLPQEYSKIHLVEGEGHISIFIDYLEAMIDELLALGRQ